MRTLYFCPVVSVAEIVSLVWGTPANFTGFRVLAALLHCTLVVGVSQTAALKRGRHLYSVGRPSRWAFAHISSYYFWAHQHKAAGLKIKLSKIKMVATASHSVTIVLWKETAFPL